MIYPVPDKKFWIQLFTLATLFLTIKCLWIQEESLRQYKVLLIYSCCLMKFIPIFDNLLIIKIHRVCVPLTDLPWHLVSSTPTTFIIQHKKKDHFKTRIHPRNSNFWKTTTHPRNSNFSSIQMFLTMDSPLVLIHS